MGGVSSHDRPATTVRAAGDGNRTGPQIQASYALVDHLAAFRGVVLAQQQAQWNVSEFGVTVEALAVGESELRGFEIHVEVVGRVVAERAQVEAVEQTQLLQEHRPLAPWTALL